MIRNQKYVVIFFYILIFICIFFLTLNTNYVEGDDASTILYHLCGRDSLIQKPYAPYHSGFDFLLKYLPATNEVLLRTTAVYVSFIFGFLVLVLVYFFFQEFFNHDNKQKFYFLLLLPFIIPQLIFQSLLINATNVSFTFAMISLILYLKYLKFGFNKYLIFSGIFMGLSIPFRWSIITFYPVFVSFFFIYNAISLENVKNLLKHISFFTVLSLIIGFILIFITGYSAPDVLKTMVLGKQYMDNADRSILAVIAMATAFLTPQLVLILLIGLLIYFKKHCKNLRIYLILFFPLVPYMILGFFPDLKYSISLLPLILIVAYKGYIYIFDKLIYNVTFCISLLCLWFIGISINLENSMFGPNFCFKKINTININKSNKINEKNTDKRVILNAFKPVFDGGVYMPTAEGGRPLYGYFYVLFQDGWSNNIQEFKKGSDFTINKLIANKDIIFLQDRQTAFLQADLYRLGFSTSMNFKLNKIDQTTYRDFTKNNETIRLQIVPKDVDIEKFVLDYFNKNDNVIYRSSYSSSILKILNKNPKLKFIDIYTLYKGDE